MTTSRTLRRVAVILVGAATPVLAQNTPPVAAPPRPPAATDTSTGLPVDRIAAVVGDRPILWTELMEEINERRARGLNIPLDDSTAQMALARQVIQEMIDEEVIVQIIGMGPVVTTQVEK